jgi:hypothetical protein
VIPGEAGEEGDRRGDGEVRRDGELGRSHTGAHGTIVASEAEAAMLRTLRKRWGLGRRRTRPLPAQRPGLKTMSQAIAASRTTMAA